MRLDPIDYHDTIRTQRGGAEENVNPILRCAQSLDFHGRLDRRLQPGFGDPVLSQDARLTLRSRSSVTAHRRHDERFSPGAFEQIHD